MNGANAGTYAAPTGGMTSGRTRLRDLKRSSMGDMSCFLPRLQHDDKESIYLLRRIEEMWSDSNFAFTQGNHEPLVSQRLIQKLRIAAAADFNATKNTALRGLPRTCQPIALRQSFEEIVNQGLIVVTDQRRTRIQHKPRRRFHNGEVEVVYCRRLGRIPTAQRWRRFRIHIVEAREALHSLGQPVVGSWSERIQVLRFCPQEACPPGTEQILVARADDKVRLQIAHVHGYGAAGLTHVQNQQRPVPFAHGGK